MAKKKTAKQAESPPAAIKTAAELDQDFAAKLQADTIAVRFSRRVFGARRSLTEEQKATAADAFGAGQGWVAGAKMLLDTKREEFKRATGRVLAGLACWRDFTVPYPEQGIRLLRRARLEEFEKRMKDIQSELATAVEELDKVYADARAQAKESLGDLFDPADYPPTLKGSFGIGWSFPSVDPPEYLRKLNPAIFAEQQKMVKARFAAAVVDAEQMLALELAKMLDRWLETLTPKEDGKRKTIRKDAAENFKELLARVKEMSPGANSTLKTVVEQAELVAAGINIDTLKKDGNVASALKDKIAEMQKALAVVVEDAPERAIDLED